jgi:hypothetical protein
MLYCRLYDGIKARRVRVAHLDTTEGVPTLKTIEGVYRDGKIELMGRLTAHPERLSVALHR